jgi:hypothetical protein
VMKKPYTFYKLAFGVAVLGFSAIASDAEACGQGMSRTLDLYIVKMPVSQVLGLVSERTGLIIITNDLSGDVRSLRLSGSASSVLNKLGQRNGLTWWCEAEIVRLTNAATRKTCVIQSERVSRETLQHSTSRLGIDTRRIHFGPTYGGVYLVSGPNELMANVTSAARAIAGNPAKSGVTVYRGGSANFDLPPANVSQDPVRCS